MAPIDGVIGSGSIQAIREFQAAQGLPVTGRIDPEIVEGLGSQLQRIATACRALKPQLSQSWFRATPLTDLTKIGSEGEN